MTDQNTPIEANPCKLRNGYWGCKTQQPVAVGDTVQIVTRANKQWPAEITQVVWTDGTVCICETASQDQNKQPAESEKRPASAGQRAPRSQKAATPEAPAKRSDRPPSSDAGPSDELDAMADRAAEDSEDDDDLMAAFQAFENEPPSR